MAYEAQMEADLKWRESELVIFKKDILAAGNGSLRQKVLLRAAWAILYAHYEGFSNFCWTIFVDEFNKKAPLLVDLRKDVLLFALSNKIRKARNLDQADFLKFLMVDFQTDLFRPAKIDEAPETKSNLWPNHLKEGCVSLGVQLQEFNNYETELKVVVSRRNGIAHGEQVYIHSYEDYQKYERAAIMAMHDLAVCIIDALNRESYKMAS